MTKGFEKKLKANVTEEGQASKMYAKQAKEAPTKTAKKALLAISRTEARHKRTNSKILAQLKKRK